MLVALNPDIIFFGVRALCSACEVHSQRVRLSTTLVLFLDDHLCRAPLLEECLQHHGHKGDPGVTLGTCGTIGERAQVILV